jgi:hypothetical protein
MARKRRTQVAPAMMALGYGARAIAAAEVASTAAQAYAIPYVYRKFSKFTQPHYNQSVPLQKAPKKKSDVSITMPKRKAPTTYAPTKKRNMRRGPPRVSGSIYSGISARYARANDMNSHFQTLKYAPPEFTFGTGTTKFHMVCPSQLQQCPGWSYWSGLFERYLIKWVKVEWKTSSNLVRGYSHASLDDTTLDTSLANIIKSPSVREHDFSDNARHTPQRTLKLSGAQAFKDFLQVSDANTDLGTYDGNTQVQTGGTHKFKIGLGVDGYGSGYIYPSITFGVIFRGLKDNVNIS